MTTPETRFIGGLDWGGQFGRDPIAIVLAWRSRKTYKVLRELKIQRVVWDQVASWLLKQTCNDQPLERVWCGADQPAGVQWLLDKGIPAIVIPEHGPGSVNAGMTLIASLLRTGKLAISEACPQLLEELRTLKGTQTHPDDHLIDALRYLLISERFIQDTIAEPIPLEKQATISYIPGVGMVDNPAATHAREMRGLGDDPWYHTWTDTITAESIEEVAYDEVRAFCRYLGADVPEFLKKKPVREGIA